jgi:MoaA/NifB/PqqE/SkfB family radical SAM enzyme/ubiquinone/menaquinone biosynthesis C-methylase UbiE
VLHTPPLTRWETADGIHLALDAEGPSWVATDERGARVIALLDGRRTLGEVATAAARGAHPAASLQQVTSLAEALVRAGIAAAAPFERPPYAGRADRLADAPLRELWIHLNDACNLRCEHCLVSSGPDGGKGLSTEALTRAIDEAAALGVEHVFFTGGEPFLRKDLYALAERVTDHHGLELVVLTNATVLDAPGHAAALERLDRGKVRFQVSIDGTSPEENDPIRGAGTFARASAGLARLSAMGFETALTLVPHRQNLRGLPGLPALAKRLGAKSVHLMWGHRRGRGLAVLDDLPGAEELLPITRAVRDAAREHGVRLDNVESLRRRVDALPNVKHDLGMAGVESVCLYTDGALYPSAATAGHAALSLGRLDGRSLADVWRSSPVVAELRAATLAKSAAALADPLRFLTGGGDLEHAYFWSGSFVGADPYAPLVSELARDVMVELARAGRARVNRRSGFDAPVVLHAMGEGALACGDEVPGAVRTLHSNCVLAFDVDRPRALMRAFYGAAAETPKEDLCCPVRPSEDDLAHIPKDVVDRFYGCGSPVRDAALRPGEAHLDLGSGAGIDVFIAAKHVGPMGRAIGVDMTDAMLAVANENRPLVARKLGYDVASFCKGVLEEVPLPDAHVDCVTSNCVVNLSPDKRAVFSEIWRVLRDHGRLVLADIVADAAVPPHLRVNPQLWGECLSGALTEEELLAELERAGFHGVEILARTLWRIVEGTTFHSLTVRAYKHEERGRREARDHRATYLGPYAWVTDEHGHVFRRNAPTAVSADVADKLCHAPYAGSFVVRDAEGALVATTFGARAASTSRGGGCCA